MRTSVEDFTAYGGLKTINPGEQDDLMLVAYSFEPRCSTVVRSLADPYGANIGVVYFNEEIVDPQRRTAATSGFDEMRHRLADFAQHVWTAKGSLQKPSVQLQSFKGLFARPEIAGRPPKSITIDATAFNRETLLILSGLLDAFFPQAKKRIVYVSPESYGEWLSAGFQQVRNVIGLGGLQDPGKKTLLVVLCGYEHHRAIKTIEEYEPAKVLLGFGDEPTEGEFLRRNMEELERVGALALTQQEVDKFAFPADGIMKCFERLDFVVGPYVDSHNVVVAPMSTKLSTIAAYLLAKKHAQVQVSYCAPAEYNIASYSKGAKSVFIEELT